MYRIVPPTLTSQILIVSPTSVLNQNGPASTAFHLWKNPGSHATSLRMVSTTCFAAYPPTVTSAGPLTSSVPLFLDASAAQSAKLPSGAPHHGPHARAKGLLPAIPVQRMMASAP